MTDADVVALTSPALVRTPIVSTRHFAARRGATPAHRSLVERLQPRLAAEIAVSDYIAGAVDVDATVVLPGVPDRPDLPPPSHRDRTVLVAQRLEREKSTEVAIAAFAASGLPDRGWRLRIAGDGSHASALKHLADLLAQAEHDADAQAILMTPDPALAMAVVAAVHRILPTLPRAAIAGASWRDHGTVIVTRDLAEAAALSDRIAPEHLELCVDDPEALAARVRHAGAIFLGAYTSESLGDYCAGPNHVLPTSGTARFSSPLGVYDFQKRSSIINCSAEGASTLGKVASVLARGESLTAHARSAEYRIK